MEKCEAGERMFLHIGDNILLAKKDIIAILNWETEKERNTNMAFFKNLQQEKKTIFTCKDKDKIKSLVLTEDGVYLSPISSQTLKKRGERHPFHGE